MRIYFEASRHFITASAIRSGASAEFAWLAKRKSAGRQVAATAREHSHLYIVLLLDCGAHRRERSRETLGVRLALLLVLSHFRLLCANYH